MVTEDLKKDKKKYKKKLPKIEFIYNEEMDKSFGNAANGPLPHDIRKRALGGFTGNRSQRYYL